MFTQKEYSDKIQNLVNLLGMRIKELDPTVQISISQNPVDIIQYGPSSVRVLVNTSTSGLDQYTIWWDKTAGCMRFIRNV